MPAISDKDLLSHLREHYGYLCSDINAYLGGSKSVIARTAVTLRVLFHETAKSKPLLLRLTRKYGGTLFFKSSFNPTCEKAILYLGFFINGEPDLSAPFMKFVDFSSYWNELVYKEGDLIYTRKQIIIFAANKWGGAHVADEIPEKYLRLVKSGGPRLVAQDQSEETIVERTVFEMGYQTKFALEEIIPQLQKAVQS